MLLVLGNYHLSPQGSTGNFKFFANGFAPHRSLIVMPSNMSRHHVQNPLADRHHTSPEILFAQCCARTVMSETDLADARSHLSESFDWQAVFQYARRHNVVSLLNRHLKSFPAEYVPLEVLKKFNDFAHQNHVHSLYLSAILSEVVKIFEGDNLPLLAFKGPALAVAAYGDVALRQFGDLDVLVFPEDVGRARDLLVNQQFAPAADFDDAKWERVLQSEYHLSFFHAEQRCLLELHWRVLPRYFGFAFDARDLWQRHIRLNIPGGTIRTFSNEDYLLVLCAHGAKHAWERLSWLCDVAEILRRGPSLDWDYLTHEARRLEGENYLRLGLILARQMLDAPLPAQLTNAYLQDANLMKLAANVRTFLCYTGDRRPQATGMLKFHLGIHSSYRNKLRYMRDLLLIPSIADHKQHPETNGLLTAFNRPLGLIRRQTTRKKGGESKT